MGDEPSPTPPRRRRGLLLLAGVALLLVVVAALAALDLLAARSALTDGRTAAEAGLTAARDGDLAAAAERFGAAEEDFARADERLGSVALVPARVLPVVGTQVAAIETLADAGGLLAAAAGELTGAFGDLEGGIAALAPRDGALPVDVLASLAGPAATARERLDAAAAELEAGPRDGLVGPVRDASVEVARAVATAREPVEAAAVLTRALPPFLGADEPRRYFVAAQNPAELRGTGGYMGAYSILTVDAGAIAIEDFGPIQDLPVVAPEDVEPPSEDFAARYDAYGGAGYWPNVNMTPDFPSAAVAIERSYEVATDTPLDGVIAADPFALAALVELAGPVEVPGIGPIEAGEVVEVVANEAYAELQDSEARKRLLGTIATQALGDVLRGRVPAAPQDVVTALADAARDGHLLLHARDPDVQRVFEQLGVSGALASEPGDSVAVIANNAAANKVDYYTRREVRYAVELREGGRGRAEIDIALFNDAPTEGLPSYVIGPNIDELQAGDNRSILSVFCGADCDLTGYDRSAGDEPLVPEEELGHEVWTTTVDVPSGAEERVELSWDAATAWQPGPDGGGRYHFSYDGQPTVRPTHLVVEVALPPGTQPLALPEGATSDGRVVRWEGDPTTEASLTLHLRPVDPPPRGWWAGLRDVLGRPLLHW